MSDTLTPPPSLNASEFKESLLQARLEELEAKIRAAEAKLANAQRDAKDAKFLADVNRAYQKARVSCNNPRHILVCSWDKAKNTCACPRASKQTEHVRDLKFILDEMVPYVNAKCKCERDALAIGPRFNYTGMPANRWVTTGAMHVGIGDHPSTKKVMPLNYMLTEEAQAYFQKKCPAWFFYSDSILTHDHPHSHTAAKMASYHVMEESLPRATAESPLTVIDINGNPASNMKRCSRNPHLTIHTVCKRHTPKDELRRAMKWGMKFDDEGNFRWHELWDREVGVEGSTLDESMFRAADVTTMFHVLYYYSPAELERYLARTNQDHIIYATVHKHAGLSGTLNNGEQKWVRNKVDGHDMITQTNTVGGESYVHAPLDWVWGKSSMPVTRTHGLTWDVNLVLEDTYLLRIKRYARATIGDHATPGDAFCPECKHCNLTLPPTPEEVRETTKAEDVIPVNDKEWIARFNTVVVHTGVDFLELEIDSNYIGVLNDMRIRMEGRQRNMEEYQSMLSMLRTKTKARAVACGKELEYRHFRNMAVGVFWMDAVKSASADSKLWNDTYGLSLETHFTYTKGGHGKQRALVDAAIDMASANSIRHATLAALQHFRRHNSTK